MKCPGNYSISRLVQQAVNYCSCRVVSHTLHVLRLTFLGRTAISLAISFTVMLNKTNTDLFQPKRSPTRNFSPTKVGMVTEESYSVTYQYCGSL